MSDVKRCAACGKENPVSEMKVCMHHQMHRHVCDSKCMTDFYNLPKKPTAVELEAKVAALEAELAKLREECKIHRNSAAGAHNQLRANRLETERLAVDWQAAVAERDTLRTQLAEIEPALVAKNHEAHDLEIDNRQLRTQLAEARELLEEVRTLECRGVDMDHIDAWLGGL